MGAGKSTVGRCLAQRLGRAFVDLDAEIEQRAQTTVARIFERDGEPAFRALERDTLAQQLDARACVIATGGGAVLDPVSRDRLRECADVVHLHAGVDAQLRRLEGDATRPLLARGDRAAVLHALALQRAPLYREVASMSIDTDMLDADAVVDRILASLPRTEPLPP
ncbi:shikimate kinase [Lysobacter bugurensis]|uniref:Shikimate kinase n=2 Tax=Cognatilysobacter bugurensis TaxID=543356 RepID=A0A918T0W6_9GAMM|nr:shikimate kinase [Lysobacter bugurensis]